MGESTLVALVSLGAGALFVLGVPIFLVIALWVMGTQLIFGIPLANIGSAMFEGLNSFSLLAMPLFILTGDVIAGGGVARRMTTFILAVVGWLRGGLGIASVVASGTFAAITGSNAATTATIGSITYPTMTEHGYNRQFAAATAAAGGTVGIIIPPSILFIVYGYIVHLPISELFLAGLIPGALMVIAMATACFRVSHKHRYGTIIPFEIGRVARTAPGACLGFAAIFVVLAGIYAGLFSPTEAAAVAVVYALIVGMTGTRELTVRALPHVLLRSAAIVGVLAPLVVVSIMMQEILAFIGAKEVIQSTLEAVGGYYGVLFAMMLVVLAAGTVLESVPNCVILAPILAPIAAEIGVNPFHFAVVFMIGDAIGFITPPYGLNLYVASSITGLPYLSIVPRVLPYLLSLMVVWLLVALFPQLSTLAIELSGLAGAGSTMY